MTNPAQRHADQKPESSPQGAAEPVTEVRPEEIQDEHSLQKVAGGLNPVRNPTNPFESR